MPLDPQQKPLLDLLAANPRDPATVSPEEMRATYRLLMANRRGPEVAHVEERRITGPAGQIPARAYRPVAEGPLPLLVYFHGGGWTIGGLDTHDGACRRLANASGCVVLSVDYRLAPEARFPAAVEDAYAATCWAAENAAALGAAPGPIAVGGDSAGGNLATVVSRLARERGGPAIAHQLLIYPATDLTFETPYDSYAENGKGYLLTLAIMHWFVDHYLARPEEARNPLASPLLAAADALAGLPPATVVTAEFDPLRDEGEAYARRLREAGVPVELRRWDGLIHDFLLLTDTVDRAREAADWTGSRLRAALRA